MPESRPVRVLVAGYGVVARSLHGIVEARRAEYRQRYGLDLSLVGVARTERVAYAATGLQAGNPNRLPWKSGTVFDLIGEAEADVFVEATPTNLKTGQPALGHVRAAFAKGLPVVMANKGPLVVNYRDVVDRASKAGVPVRFEATVAGCVPTLNAARYGFSGDTIRRIDGILNGTTNFILSRMSDEGSDLDQALSEAQSLGYAEADPATDLEGLDAAAKLVILANTLLGQDLTLADVATEGIRGVSREAVEVAAAHGYRIKLIAEAQRDGAARVGPRLVRRGSTLDVAGVLNAVRFSTELAGTVTHIGHGAGGHATAAAILSDVLDIFDAARSAARGGRPTTPPPPRRTAKVTK